MIGETAWLRKYSESTWCPRGKRHCRPKHEINRNVYIGHDSSVGVCFVKR